MIESKRLMTASLRSSPWGEKVVRVLTAAMQAVDPAQAVQRFVRRNGSQLWVNGKTYFLDDYREIYVVGAGKAGAPMAGALVEILGDFLDGGLVVVKEGYGEQSGRGRGGRSPKIAKAVQIVEAGHPIPDRRGVQAAQQIIEIIEKAGRDALVFCLLSGGGSALMTSPSRNISLEDLQVLTALLLGCGATIQEINTLRKHLDRVKGGKLAYLAAPARVITLILSDVIGDPLDMIASGPMAPDPTTFADAFTILERYHLVEKTPAAILAYLQEGLRGEVAENPKAGDPIFDAVQNVIVGNNLLAAQAALTMAEQEGFHTLLLTTYLQGEARYAGRFLAAIGRQVAGTGQPAARPACLIYGGETTVTLSGNGLGGRNQELALGAVTELADIPDVALVSLATDGGDGPTDAAGAVVTGETLSRAFALGMHPRQFLERNDSYHFFEKLGDLLKTGPTCTNVNDLMFFFAF